jgi:transcriptional regulator with XRE-family HTH domain
MQGVDLYALLGLDLWVIDRLVKCQVPLPRMREDTKARPSRLGEQIAKRLAQLGMSRRELSRRIPISRQTLHLLEHEPERNFAPSTFAHLDQGLKWAPGTAKGFHEGTNADPHSDESLQQRIQRYLNEILSHLENMDIDQLEREVLMLEEDAYGRDMSCDDSSSDAIRRTISRLRQALDSAKGTNGQ